ncbi:MAG: extracellular solute-binding protein, partial [Anaerolineales bacterium]|nr:extracellular solute-binding protein [Anaerolineales bacterium]
LPILQSRTLTIWVPPQFDPANGSTAGNLFLSRLDEFLSRRPQTEIQIRVKTLSGEFGLLDSLQVTSSAAPIIMPDLIALPRTLLEQAFREGLVIPLDELTDTIVLDDWYDYAMTLALVDEQIAGIPFAGDLMVLAYKNDSDETPPPSWDAVLKAQKALAFPASDPRGLVTLALYQSLAGDLVDVDNQPFLQEDALLEVLSYYQQAQAASVMPYWLTQFETDQQSWQSYQDRQSTLAITWSSILLGSDSPNTSMAAMPTRDEKPFSYADGWVWCVIPSDLETEKEAVELAEFLTEASYLATWGVEGGYLPVRPSGLESWAETSNYATLQQLLPSALLLPGNELLIELGPDIRDAVVGVLKDQIEPQIALEDLIQEVQGQ